MSAKNKKYKRPISKAPAQAAAAPTRPQQLGKEGVKIKFTQLHYILIGCVVAVTFFCYHGTLNNHFTNWDDGLYVESCPYIKNLTQENVKMILFHNITNNYYHPLTMLTFAANYHYAKMDPHAYYLTDVTIFLFDGVMMFCLALILLETVSAIGYGPIKGTPWYAALCAVFYVAHPMHVESVSWMAERKDIMYAFFYFLGLIMYIKYAANQTMKRMGFVVLCFILSLSSKPMAVFFPLSLFAFDVLLKRDKETSAAMPIFGFFTAIAKFFLDLLAKLKIKFLAEEGKTYTLAKLIAEKVPFVLICIASGLWSYYTADKAGSIASFHAFSFITRFFFASHNFMMYIAKAFVPIGLCSYYPYPNTDTNGMLPIMFYMAPLIDLVIVSIPLYLSYRAGEKYFRMTLFGGLFFLFNVVFILQFISAGPAIMCERYTDVAYFGLFFPITWYVFDLINKKPAILVPVVAVLAVVTGTYAYLCQERTKVWHNTETLWKDVILKYPSSADTLRSPDGKAITVVIHAGVETAYKNLGNYFVQDKNPPDYDSAYLYYTVLEQTKSTDAGVYSNLGNIWAIRGNINKSLEEYTHSLKLDSNSFDTYLNRAITYSKIGQFELALKDYNRAYKMNSKSENLLENRAYTYLSAKKYAEAINDYNDLIKINPDIPSHYANRGVAESNSGNQQAALADFMHDLEAEPKNGNTLFNISAVYQQMKDYKNSLTYALKAKQVGYQVSDADIQKLQEKINNGGK